MPPLPRSLAALSICLIAGAATAATSCVPDALDDSVPTDEVLQALSGSGSGGGGPGSGGPGTGSGGASYWPIVTADGRSGTFISVGYLWNYRITGGTFNSLTLPATVDLLNTTYQSRVSLIEYCSTLNCIIAHNYSSAPTLTQLAMSSAWGRWCSAVPGSALSACQ